ncbi:hypothetical protein V2G26_019758 [Clonostachys chloroleuca]
MVRPFQVASRLPFEDFLLVDILADRSSAQLSGMLSVLGILSDYWVGGAGMGGRVGGREFEYSNGRCQMPDLPSQCSGHRAGGAMFHQAASRPAPLFLSICSLLEFLAASRPHFCLSIPAHRHFGRLAFQAASRSVSVFRWGTQWGGRWFQGSF